ncbi:MAG TPA: hypothetical protein VFA11_09620 [Acidimicrobiales bacterium]|nr:hypothetical protein [Acidimicrobiales bacterium]
MVGSTVAGSYGPRRADASDTTSGPVSGFGDATVYGAPAAGNLRSPIVGILATPDSKGYWLVGADGGVFTEGDAGFYGSEGGSGVLTPLVGMASTPDGRGYWITGNRGNVYNFGDATSEPGVSAVPQAPVVGITATPAGFGYWLVSADGGVFTQGNATFHGSMGGTHLAAPVVGMASTPDGQGYWLVAADGGVFSFGDATFHGSMGGTHLAAPMVGMASTPDGHGYWLVAADGGVFTFGDATFHGSMGAAPPGGSTPVAGMAATTDGGGYWLTTTDKSLPPPARVPSVLAQCNLPGAPPAIEPGTIMLACGDGNAYLDHLRWSSWTGTAATATGVYTHNTCTPSCAGGTFVSAPTTVRLSYPAQTRAGKEFGSVSYTATTASGGSSTFTEVAPTSPG